MAINRHQRRKRRHSERGFGGRFGLLLAATLLVLVTGSSAYAQDFAAAGQHFASAQDAFAQGQYELAAKEFQAAYDITRDPAMLLSIGESWQRAGDGKKALAGYRAYLAAQPQAPDRAEVEGRIAAIESAQAGAAAPGAPATGPAGAPAAGTAPATPGPAGATTPAGATGPATTPAGSAPTTQSGSTPTNGVTPSAPATTQPGDATKPAAAPEKTPEKVKDAKGDAGSQPLVTPPERPASRLRTAGWVTVAVAIALATSGAIVGLGAQDRADELRRRTTVLIGNQPPVYDEGQAEAYTTLKSEGTAYNQASIALLSAAGAVAVTAGVLFIVDYVRRPRAETRAKGGWALGPWLSPGAAASTGGLIASGSF